MPHILVVDDDTRLRALLRKYLTDNGFLVVSAESAASAREQLKYLSFDLVLLDVMMPQETGIEFLKKLRAKSQVPVLMLTAMAEGNDRINGLEQGADDYLTKPFEPKELVLRINSILKRVKPVSAIKVETSGNLTTAEQHLLGQLTSQPNQAITREEIAKKNGIDERAVDVQIARLRKKLVNPNQIQTVRGSGYKIIT